MCEDCNFFVELCKEYQADQKTFTQSFNNYLKDILPN